MTERKYDLIRIFVSSVKTAEKHKARQDDSRSNPDSD